MKKILALIAFLLVAPPAVAQQSVLQSGQFVTPGHAAAWVTNGVIGDAGTAQTPVLTSIGTVGQGNTICANSGPQTAPYNQLCIGANLNSAAQIVLQNFAGATAQNLQFVVNGVTTTFPSGPLLFQVGSFINGDCLKASGTAGGVADAGAICGSGGGGGSPGGSNTQVQYNNAGVFGGVTGVTSNGTTVTFGTSNLLIQGLSSGTTALASANASGTNFTITFPAATGTVALTSNIPVASVANSDGTLTISPTTGSVIASLALGHTNTWTAAQTFTNSDLLLLGSSTGVTTFTSANAGVTNFTQTVQAITDTLVDRTTTDTLTNKTLASSTNSLGGNTISVGSDATGDVWYRNSAGIFTRLGIGATNQVLTVSAGLPSWQTPAAGGTVCTTTALSLQYNNAGALGCVADWTSDGTSVTGALGTITTNVKALTITGTFNAGGTTFDAPFLMTITDTASATGSKLVDITKGGTTGFTITNEGSGGAILAKFTGTNAAGYLAIDPVNGVTPYTLQVRGYSLAVLSGGGWTTLTAGGVGTPRTGFFELTSAANADAAGDTTLFRDAAVGVIALGDRAATTAATSLRVYNTTDNVATNTAPTNYERGVFDWTTTANTLTIGTQSGGSGTARTMILAPKALYSAAGIALPSCTSSTKGYSAVVSDATGPTYNATYSSGGAVTAMVVCNGTNWVTQ